MQPQPARVKAVFDDALEISAPAERQAFLDRACADAPDVRRQVEALLRAYEAADSFLESPPAVPGLTDRRPAAAEGLGAAVGPYQLLKPLGAGGMGAVFLAEQREPVRRQVALKVIKPGMDSKAVLARFEAERQALALMDHRPGVRRVPTPSDLAERAEDAPPARRYAGVLVGLRDEAHSPEPDRLDHPAPQTGDRGPQPAADMGAAVPAPARTTSPGETGPAASRRAAVSAIDRLFGAEAVILGAFGSVTDP